MVIRTITSFVVAAALAVTLANLCVAQNGIRFASNSSRGAQSKTKSPQAKARLASQNVADGAAEDIGQPTGVSDGYIPSEVSSTISPGCAYGGFGAYGYNPDFGFGPNGMSVWPGVPACCDPWFGYCGEPRCFYECNCHQGTYQMFHCPKCNGGACGPELLKWQKGDWVVNCCKPAAMCYGSGCTKCASRCATCQPSSYTSTPTPAAGTDGNTLDVDQHAPGSDGPAVTPAPQGHPQPPRNTIPASAPSARRTPVRSA